MDFLLPDDETVKKMCEEYASSLKASALSYIKEATDDYGDQSLDKISHTRTRSAPDILDIKVLFLYIILLLRYNARYGTQIYDADRGVGRVRSARCAFGSLNNLVSNNG